MSWISLATNRYNLRDILHSNAGEDDDEEMRFSVVDAADGRDALLIGDNEFVKKEIERAEFFLEKYEDGKKPPHPAVVSQILSFAVIASLGEKDYSKIFELIAKAKIYRNQWEKTLQLIAKRIVEAKPAPDEPYEKKGHVTKEEQWFKLVEKAPVSHAYNLAVCPDHSGWTLMCSYVLPLAFQLCRERNRKDWKKDLRELLKWGGPFPEEAGTIVYERTSEKPGKNSKAEASDKTTARGFDAVEIKGDELYAYYYLGAESKACKDVGFLEHVELDWKPVKKDVTEKQWTKIAGLRENCVYVIVYNASRCSVSESDLAKAGKRYELNPVARDITEL